MLRFDYMANGDSEGDFSQFSVETALADINCAIDLLKARTSAEQVGLLGLRLGASFATRAAAARRDVSTLVLWAPIVDCSRYMQELLRINLTTQMAVYKEIRADREALIASLRVGQSVSVDGFDIGLSLYEQMSGLRLSEGSGPLVDRCFIAQIDRNETAPLSRDLEGLRAACPNATLQLVREDPFWKEIDRFYDTAPNLSAATIAWLKDAMTPHIVQSRLPMRWATAWSASCTSRRRRDTTVPVILAAGVKARIGPHGVYPQLARMFVEQGFSVVRFDFWGLGDSEGTATEPLLADLYGSVSCGRYVDDTMAAVQWTCDTLTSRKSCSRVCAAARSPACSPAHGPARCRPARTGSPDFRRRLERRQSQVHVTWTAGGYPGQVHAEAGRSEILGAARQPEDRLSSAGAVAADAVQVAPPDRCCR